MRVKSLLVVVMVTLCFPQLGLSQEKKTRKWDQEEAIKRVKAIIAQEEAGDFAWDKIQWNTDPAEAIALSKKQEKPIFLYFFLKGEVGPAAAPC